MRCACKELSQHSIWHRQSTKTVGSGSSGAVFVLSLPRSSLLYQGLNASKAVVGFTHNVSIMVLSHCSTISLLRVYVQSPGSLLYMQDLRVCPRPVESASAFWQDLQVIQIHALKFEKHCTWFIEFSCWSWCFNYSNNSHQENSSIIL